jgi:hypothetical protein
VLPSLVTRSLACSTWIAATVACSGTAPLASKGNADAPIDGSLADRAIASDGRANGVASPSSEATVGTTQADGSEFDDPGVSDAAIDSVAVDTMQAADDAGDVKEDVVICAPAILCEDSCSATCTCPMAPELTPQCASGVCVEAMQLIAPGEVAFSIVGMAADAAHVYFGASDGRGRANLSAVPRQGGSTELVFSTLQRLEGPFADGIRAYWSGLGAPLYASSSDGGVPTTIALSAPLDGGEILATGPFAANGTNVFFSSCEGSNFCLTPGLFEAPSSGGMVTQMASTPAQGPGASVGVLASTSTEVYWAARGATYPLETLMASPLDGGAAAPMAASPNLISRVKVRPPLVYYYYATGSSIMAVGSAGAPTQVATAAGRLGGLDFTDTYLYWLDLVSGGNLATGCGRLNIMRVPVGGGSPEVVTSLVIPEASPVDVLVEPEATYVALSNAVLRVTSP